MRFGTKMWSLAVLAVLALTVLAAPVLAAQSVGTTSAKAGTGGVTKGLFVKLSAAGTIVTATAVGDSVVGVCEQTSAENALTKYAPVGMMTIVTSGEEIAVGDLLTAGTGGKAFVLDDSDSSDQRYAALALTAATGADEDVTVIVVVGSEQSFVAPASLDVGGGYGDSGVSISAAGVIQADGAITSGGAVTGTSLIGSAATTGGTAIELTGLSVRSTGSAFDVLLASSDAALGADRTITLNPGAGNRTVALAGDVSFGAAVTTVGAFNVSGAFSTVGDDALILRTGAATDLTLPTTGTLATLTGAETLTTKTIDGDDNTVQDLGVGVHKVLSTVTTSTVGTPFVICFAPASAGTYQYTVPAGKKLRVIDAYGFKTVGAGANADDELTLQNNDGTPGNIFDKLELIAVTDKLRFQFDNLDDAEMEVSAGHTLDLVANENAEGGCDSLVSVLCVWVAP